MIMPATPRSFFCFYGTKYIKQLLFYVEWDFTIQKLYTIVPTKGQAKLKLLMSMLKSHNSKNDYDDDGVVDVDVD